MYRVYKRIADQLSTLADSYIGDPPDAAPVPYTFVWGDLPVRGSSLLASTLGEVDFEAHITVVAHSPANVLALAAQAEQIINRWQPVIPGWRVFPIDVTGSEPVQTARGVFEPSTNRYPAWVVLHLKIMAVKLQEGADG